MATKFRDFTACVDYVLRHNIDGIGIRSKIDRTVLCALKFLEGYNGVINDGGAGFALPKLHAQDYIEHKNRWRSIASLRCTVCQTRKQWGNITADCRTYEGQPRRDMLDDSSMSQASWNKFQSLVLGFGPEQFIAAVKCGHSVEQLVNMASPLVVVKKGIRLAS